MPLCRVKAHGSSMKDMVIARGYCPTGVSADRGGARPLLSWLLPLPVQNLDRQQPGRVDVLKGQLRTLRQPGLEIFPRPLDVEHLDRMLLELVVVEIDDFLSESDCLELGPCVELGIDCSQHHPGQ